MPRRSGPSREKNPRRGFLAREAEQRDICNATSRYDQAKSFSPGRMAQGSVCIDGLAPRYGFGMAESVDFTISFESPDEGGWIVARVLEVPGAMSQGHTREEARENVLDALRTVLTPDEELAVRALQADQEHLRFVAAA